LIVLATHGRTGVKRLLIGNVAEKVVRHATSPVLTVKPRVVSRRSRATGANQGK
jgi:nucleotide-binding universal stress UspA family protein